jgi:exopolysaccharide biosynthesis polyprenyl glycosylphosphotransferase
MLREPTSTTPGAAARATTGPRSPEATFVAPAGAPDERPRLVAALKGLQATGGPAACVATAAYLTPGAPMRVASLVVAGFVIAYLLRRPLRRHADQLPLMRHLGSLVGALLAGAFLVVEHQLPLTPWLALQVGVLCVAAVVGSVLGRRPLVRARKRGIGVRRVAVIGSDRVAAAFADELRAAPERGFVPVGRIAPHGDEDEGTMVLGSLADLERLVQAHHLDLLVLSPDAAGPLVLDRVTNACLDLDVRMVDMDSFCERIFGHVPVTEINSSWFRFFMHPTFRRTENPLKRVLDLVIATVVALVAAPIIAVLAVLVRRDGGEAFFTQTRIGAGGRPFTIYKLRTMNLSNGSGPGAWTTSDDPRITGIGHFLRRTHLDELPQILNVLRGDMSLVGPRPEQPSYVAKLEREVPHYSRRHLIKPGVTGWAQVRCGYAGTTEGSAWKMCHDLYYVKHRSMMLDLLIIGETARTLLADRQYPEGEAGMSAFIRPAPQTA